MIAHARPRLLGDGQHRRRCARAGCQTTTNFHLYKPDDALRGLDRAVAIDYYLKQPAQKVTMEFLDAQGKVIRTFTGTPADAERKPPEPSDDDDGFRRPPDRIRRSRPACSALTWDMRYPGATDFPGPDHVGGELARPARAARDLSGAGDRRRGDRDQPFAIRREPTLLKDVTDQDLQEQFDLAIKVRDKASQANEAVLLVRGIKAQIQDRKGKLDAKSGAAGRRRSTTSRRR